MEKANAVLLLKSQVGNLYWQVVISGSKKRTHLRKTRYLFFLFFSFKCPTSLSLCFYLSIHPIASHPIATPSDGHNFWSIEIINVVCMKFWFWILLRAFMQSTRMTNSWMVKRVKWEKRALVVVEEADEVNVYIIKLCIHGIFIGHFSNAAIFSRLCYCFHNEKETVFFMCWALVLPLSSEIGRR